MPAAPAAHAARAALRSAGTRPADSALRPAVSRRSAPPQDLRAAGLISGLTSGDEASDEGASDGEDEAAEEAPPSLPAAGRAEQPLPEAGRGPSWDPGAAAAGPARSSASAALDDAAVAEDSPPGLRVYTKIVAACNRARLVGEVRELYGCMVADGLTPSRAVLSRYATALAHCDAAGEADALHATLAARGEHLDSFFYNHLIAAQLNGEGPAGAASM